MLAALVVFIMLATGYDAQLTRRRLASFGPDIELNPLVRWLARRGSINLAVRLGVIAPSAILAVAGAIFAPLLLAFYAGMRAQLLIAQLLSKRAEMQLEGLIRK